MTIGIFGGTFNPPHIGHLIVIESVRDQFHYDKILFIPSANPPNKSDPTLPAAGKRLEMTRLAVRNSPEFEVSDVEARRGGISYSIDTLTALSELFPEGSLSLIIGADNLMEFQTWRSPHEILAIADLVVMSRPGFPAENIKNEYRRLARFINVPSVGISSSDIRRRIKLGRSIRYLVPKEVEEYIHRHTLYRD